MATNRLMPAHWSGEKIFHHHRPVNEALAIGGGQPAPFSICISEDVPVTGIACLPLQILGSEVHTIVANSKEVVDTSNKFLALIEDEEEA
ncbi:hypothetical protein LWI28_013982 [Acer negundo]|uniref:Uncharacterized protein n=1 Tax=Acer negundo TaxID=4023 RepID=A0AAD5IMH1_ACENE|nr:hypothetical protein LWI28_013982 [Acer negundo]